MLLKKYLKRFTKILSIIVVVVMLASIMFLYFDYSAQLPFVTVTALLLIEYIMFLIFTKKIKVKLINKDKTFMNNNTVHFEIRIDKGSRYPYKRITVDLCRMSKYENEIVKQKLDVELNDDKFQVIRFDTKNVSYGYTDVMIEDICIYDVVGLGSRKLKAYNDKIKVFVMPKVKEVNIEMPKIPYVGGDETEIFLEDRGKDGTELYEIREFRDGDKLRQIHWKLSSKTDEYMVRDLVTPIDTNIYVFFDLCNDGKINLALENAVSISYELVNLKYAFYIAWLDGENMRMRRKLVSEEKHIEEAVMELMRCPLYEKNNEVMNILNRFCRENHEVYNLFILQ
jgi:Ca2+/Na+ antiporter